MAARKKKQKTLTDNQVARMVRDSAHQIWLAGLGAYAKAEEEGSKIFETLAQVGEKLEKRTRKTVGSSMRAAEATVAGVRDTATDTWDRLEDMFESRVAQALHAMNIPTGDEIAGLAERVEELRKAVAKQGGTAVKAATKKTSGKKKTRKKAAKKKSAAKKKKKTTRKKATRRKAPARKKAAKKARKKTARKKKATRKKRA